MGSGGDAAAQKLSLLQHDQRRGLLFVGGRGLTVRSADFATDRQLEGTRPFSKLCLARGGDFFDVTFAQVDATHRARDERPGAVGSPGRTLVAVGMRNESRPAIRTAAICSQESPRMRSHDAISDAQRSSRQCPSHTPGTVR